MNMNKKKSMRYFLYASALFLLMLFLSVLSLRFGSVRFSVKEFASALARKQGYENLTAILYYFRLPRLMAAVIAGAGLSVSGLLLQNLTGNALAGPNIIGVNAGAGFFVIAGMYFMEKSFYLTPAFAFAGAFLATVFILLISLRARHMKSSIVLAGVAVSSLLSAGISLLSLLDTDILALYNDFAVGGIADVKAEKLYIPSAVIALGIIAAVILSSDVDALTLGDSIARSMGVHAGRTRFVAAIIASACAGAVVSFAGLLGFVGLMVPHIAKRLFTGRTRPAILFSTLLGACLVLASDLAGRCLFRGTEIPVGIIMAAIGVPFFLWLIIGRRER